MSVKGAQIVRARPIMLQAKARGLVADEICKGCRPEIAPVPVMLEPVFQPIGSPEDVPGIPGQPLWIEERLPAAEELARLQIWVSPEQECKWERSESLLRQLHAVTHPVALEIAGNHDEIVLQLLCRKQDGPILCGAFQGTFERCVLRHRADGPLTRIAPHQWEDVVVRDYLPPPPYSHLMTRPEELPVSPYATVIHAMSQIEAPAVGLYQVVFQPVSPKHDWHQNVQVLLDLEYTVKQTVCSALAPWRVQEVPSGERHGMARDVETKAHNDKPFFAAALRVAVVGAVESATETLLSLTAFSGLIQHGGRPLQSISERSYRTVLSASQLRDMFQHGLTYRPGFLVNSAELTSFVHIPSAKLGERHQAPIEILETLPAGPALSAGCHVGHSCLAGTKQPVCIPMDLRFADTHVIGKSGWGKSTVMEHLVLDDIGRGEGVAVIDPHHQLVERLLNRIPEQDVDRVIFLDFSDPNWVPIFNPFGIAGHRNRGRVADDIVGAFKGIVDGWGDRLEHLLRFTIQGLLHLPGASLLDVSNALQTKQDESNLLRKEVLKVVDNELLRRFWANDLARYRPADLHPPQHKLSKLLGEEPVASMLSQTDSSFHLRQVMDESRILIIDLSGLTDEARGILGCLLLAILRIAALSRSDTDPGQLHPFHIHVDEAQLLSSNAIEQIIAQTRKYRVSLTLANHYLRQFPQARVDALTNVGSSIVTGQPSAMQDRAGKC